MAENSVEFEFWDKINYIFTNPEFFFEKVKSEHGIKNSLIMFAIVGVFFQQ